MTRLIKSLFLCALLLSPSWSFSQEGASFEEEYLGDFLEEDEGLGEEIEESPSQSRQRSSKSNQSEIDDIELDLDEGISQEGTSSQQNQLDLDEEGLDIELDGDVSQPKPTMQELPQKTPLLDEFDFEPQISTTANKVENIQFLAQEKGGTVVIKTSLPANYILRENPENSQFVIELKNTEIPKRMERPLITKDFPSKVGSINAYSSAGGNASNVVIQMKNGAGVEVQQQGNQLLVFPKSEVPVQNAGFSPLQQSENIDDLLANSRQFRGKKINIEVQDTPLKDILNLISEESGVNMVVDNDVEGATTVKLRDTPWDQALVLVLKSNSLGYQRHGNVLRITTLEKLREEANQIKQINEAKQNSVPLAFQVVPVSYASVTDLEKQVKPFLSSRGKISSDKRTSSILINDLPVNIKQVERLIKSLDFPPPQVLIEGKVIEAQESFSKDIGVNWQVSGQDVQVGTSGGQPVNIRPELDISTGASAGNLNLNLSLGVLEFFGDLTSQLSISERDSRVKVISSPRVVTMTNVEATVHQTTEIPTITQTVSDGVVSRSVNFKPVQLQLKVTPQVTSDNSVVLNVDLKREFAGEVVEQTTQARAINQRSAKTKVLVKNGQTAVIGGIYQSDSTVSEQGVPYLRKIPLIGRLFESTSKTDEKSELMIFLTPRILSSSLTETTN